MNFPYVQGIRGIIILNPDCIGGALPSSSANSDSEKKILLRDIWEVECAGLELGGSLKKH